jgi:glycine cleavage system H protein
MPSPADLRYSDSHEWFRVEGDVVTMGITQFAADQLTDVTYAAMKPVGTALAAGESVGEVESVKTTGDVYTAVSGEIIEVNQAISADPSLVNTDPYGEGWMVRIRTSDTSPLASLKDGAAYDQSLAGA